VEEPRRIQQGIANCTVKLDVYDVLGDEEYKSFSQINSIFSGEFLALFNTTFLLG
jgi:hypothetical protein